MEGDLAEGEVAPIQQRALIMTNEGPWTPLTWPSTRACLIGNLLFLSLALSGCGGTMYTWSKPGASLQQARQDGFECKQISRQPYYVPVGGVVVGGSEPNFKIWEECLQARGYTVTISDE